MNATYAYKPTVINHWREVWVFEHKFCCYFESWLLFDASDTSEPDNVLIKKPTKDLNTRVRLHVSNIPYEMKWQELKDLFREKSKHF